MNCGPQKIWFKIINLKKIMLCGSNTMHLCIDYSLHWIILLFTSDHRILYDLVECTLISNDYSKLK